MVVVVGGGSIAFERCLQAGVLEFFYLNNYAKEVEHRMFCKQSLYKKLKLKISAFGAVKFVVA